MEDVLPSWESSSVTTYIKSCWISEADLFENQINTGKNKVGERRHEKGGILLNFSMLNFVRVAETIQVIGFPFISEIL